MITDRLSSAFRYCLLLHGAQTRKGKPIPYVAHLMSAAALVLEDGGDEDEAIAALLHDALEDRPDKTSAEEIEKRFGGKVAALVRACTDTPPDYKGGAKPSWRRRKERYLEHIRKGAEGALRVSLADKLHNARDLLLDCKTEGEALWSRFNAGKDDQLWYQRSLIAAFKQGGYSGRMLDEFERVVKELERLAGA